MAIYHDDFEAYALGNTTNPFGGFTRNLNPATIVADNYLPSGSKALRTNANFSEVYWSDGTLRNSGTVYTAIKFDQNFNNQRFFQFWNGYPLAGPGSHPVFTLATNFDGTISAFAPNATLVAVPCAVSDEALHWNTWYFLQVNFEMINLAGLVTIQFAVAIDGVTIFSGIVNTGLSVASLASGTAAFDYITLTNTLKWDEWTFDTLQTIGTYPNPGSPSGKVSTGLAEIIESTVSARAVVSTGLIELIIGGSGYVYEA